jgi:adenylosuccinate synthase
MPVDIVIGAQFGSEGKGKVCSYLGLHGDYKVAIRTGGPNAAHTVICNERKYIFRQLPSASVNLELDLLIGPGSHLRMDLLFQEIRASPELRIDDRLWIDQMAGVILDEHIHQNSFIDTPTTGQGTSPAIADRIMRKLKCIRDYADFCPYSADVQARLANQVLNDNLLLEGTQGFGLSMYQDWYPYSTSRDISVASLLSEATLPWSSVRDVYAVFRSYPIRTTDGLSNLAARETSWSAISRLAGCEVCERGTLDGEVRRVSRFSTQLAMRFAQLNRPTKACLTFADYLDSQARGATRIDQLPHRVRRFIDHLEETLSIPCCLISTGPGTNQMIDLR